MITLLIVISTSIVSILCFQRMDIFRRIDFQPYLIKTRNQYFRFVSHTFVHADWIHLIVNMLVFYSFGSFVERKFMGFQGEAGFFSGSVLFILLYFGGAIAASVPTYLKHRDNPDYVSVGASGAVSAVLFTSIFLSPLEKIYFYGVLPLPGIVFGVLYLIYSSYMSRRGTDNINHDAHFWGAVFGFVFPAIFDPNLVLNFLNQF